MLGRVVWVALASGGKGQDELHPSWSPASKAATIHKLLLIRSVFMHFPINIEKAKQSGKIWGLLMLPQDIYILSSN